MDDKTRQEILQKLRQVHLDPNDSRQPLLQQLGIQAQLPIDQEQMNQLQQDVQTRQDLVPGSVNDPDADLRKLIQSKFNQGQ